MNNSRIFWKYIISIFFLAIFTLFYTNNTFASGNIQKDGEVITPQSLSTDITIKKLSNSQNTSTKTFNNVNDAVSYIMEQAKKFEPTVQFKYKYTGKFPNFTNEIEKALTKPGYDYINGTLYTYGYKATLYSDGTANVTINLTYIGTKEQEEYVTKKVKEIAKSLTKSGMSDLEKVLAVNKYVTNLITYSTNSKTSPHHVYTALNEGKGVCQAYALLTYRLLTEMGMEARYVVGYGISNNQIEGHAWNSVKVNGVWYHLDTTWNDGLVDNTNNLIYYKYFLVTSSQLKVNHNWDESVFPVATDTRYSYINNSEIYGKDYNGYIYYVDQNQLKLYELNAHTGQKKLIDESPVNYSFNIKDNGILNYKLYFGGTEKSYKIPAPEYPPTKGKSSPIKASNVTVTNYYGKKDVIAFDHLTIGATYKIYNDKKKEIDSFKANSKNLNRSISQLGTSAGAIYVSVTVDGYEESELTKVTFKAEKKLSAIAAKNVTITNKVKNDMISFKGLKKGYTYTVYSDSKLQKKLVSFTAKSTTQKVTVKQVGVKAGAVYVVVSKAGYKSSTATKVKFKAQSKK